MNNNEVNAPYIGSDTATYLLLTVLDGVQRVNECQCPSLKHRYEKGGDSGLNIEVSVFGGSILDIRLRSGPLKPDP